MRRVVAGVLSLVGMLATSAGTCLAAELPSQAGEIHTAPAGAALVRVLEIEGERSGLRRWRGCSRKATNRRSARW